MQIDIKIKRDRDIRLSYNRLLSKMICSGKRFKRIEVFDALTKHPAPAFYISYQEAHYKLLNRRYLKITRGNSLRMYKELEKKVSYMMDQYNLAFNEALEKAINSQASSFFLSPKRIEIIYNNSIRGKHGEKNY